MPKTEKEKMLAGELYNGMDANLVAERLRARELCQTLATLPPSTSEADKADLLKQLFGVPTNVYITPPFFCDYGSNIRLGKNVYFNFNCVILDVAQVTIGDNTLFGPMVQIYTATHPMDVATRKSGLESGKPITIGKDVWVGGGAIICPGVSIGDGSVIGAGSVVTRDIPAGVFAAGNPCRVVRKIDQAPSSQVEEK